MAHARPEYAIVFAILGVLLAIGIPSLRRGQYVVGGLCMAVAALVAIWAIVVIRRERE